MLFVVYVGIIINWNWYWKIYFQLKILVLITTMLSIQAIHKFVKIYFIHFNFLLVLYIEKKGTKTLQYLWIKNNILPTKTSSENRNRIDPFKEIFLCLHRFLKLLFINYSYYFLHLFIDIDLFISLFSFNKVQLQLNFLLKMKPIRQIMH